MKKSTFLTRTVLNIVLILLLSSSGAIGATGAGYAELTPQRVASKQVTTIVLTYTVAQEGITAGGGILVHLPNRHKRHGIAVSANWLAPQVDDPLGTGYTTAITDNSDVSLQVSVQSTPCVDQIVNSGINTYAIRVNVISGDLLPGDHIQVIYGDTSEGGPGTVAQQIPQTPSKTIPDHPGEPYFAVESRATEFDEYEEIADSPSISVVGNSSNKFNVVIPSIVKVGEPFKIKVAALDAGNFRAYRFFPKEVAFGATDPGATVPGNDAFFKYDNSSKMFGPMTFGSAGVHYISVRDVASNRVFYSNPCIVKSVSESASRKLYWGDMHFHSRLSDGLRTPDEGYIYARDVALLDFTAMTDHEHMHSSADGTWWFAKQKAYEYNIPYNFVTLTAYEWSSPGSPRGYGHKCVYYFSEDYDQPLFPHKDAPGPENYLYTPDELWLDLRGRQALTIPHHPASSPASTDWSFSSYMQRQVEIASKHGISEYYFEEGDPDPYPHQVKYTDGVGDNGKFVRDAWAKGHKLGVVASSDCHDTLPGRDKILVAAYADELSKQGLLESFYNRHTYATTGGRIYLNVLADGHLMGAQYQTAESPQFTIVVAGQDPLAKVELIKYDKTAGYRVIFQQSEFGTNWQTKHAMQASYTDTEFTEDSFYYVRVIQQGEHFGDEDVMYDGKSSRAWSSPIWITKIE